MKQIVQLKVVTIFLFLLVTAGCPMPNVAPFAEATVQLRQAVVSTGDITLAAMRATPYKENDKEVPLSNSNHPANQLEKTWRKRTDLIDLLVNYSDSIYQIVAAGQSAKNTANELVNSADELAQALPGGEPFAKESAALARTILKHGIQLKAAHDVDKVVKAAHPIITKIAEIIKGDIAKLKILHDSETIDIIDSINNEFGVRNTYRKDLIDKLKPARVNMIENNLDSSFVAEVEKIEKRLAATEKDHKEYMTKMQIAVKKRQNGRTAFAAATHAIDIWVIAHHELHLAIKENRRPNVRLLLIATQEIKTAVDKVKNR